MPLRKANFMPSKKIRHITPTLLRLNLQARHRQDWERHSAFDPILRNVSEPLTGDCHLHADDRRHDFVQNSASLAQRGTADATRERPAHRS